MSSYLKGALLWLERANPIDPVRCGSNRRKLVTVRKLLLVLTAAVVCVWPVSAQQPRGASGTPVTSFYDLQTRTLTGKPADLAQYRGSVSLVVTAAPPAQAALGSWKRDVVRALRGDETVRGSVDVRPVRLGVGDGVRLSFQRMRRGERVATVQIAAVEGNRMTLLVLTTKPARARALGKTLDRIAATLAGLGGTRSPGLTS